MLLDPEKLETLQEQIVEVFQGAQHESSLHKRRVKVLCKLHAQAATLVEKGKQPGQVKRVGEKKFNDAFWKTIANVLPVRKGVVEAERAVRLVGGFVQQLTTESGENDEDEDTPVDRFIEALLRRLIPGCSAKDKTVRYRTMQLSAELISSVQSLPEEVYGTMHSALINSANDKDATVRVQTAIVLGKLAHGEDLAVVEEGVQSLTDILRNLMQFDPSPEVRRAALPGVHTQLNKHTLPVLLSRAKDTDANVRCTVFRVLKTTPVPARSLSLEQRTLVVRCGLGDRSPVVKAEASKLLARWVDGTQDLEGFISLFDLSSDNIAEDALGAVLAERPELLNGIDLSPESFWEEMTPEKSLLARVFASLSTSSTSAPDFSDRLPVLTLLAFKIQLLFNTCLNWVQEHASGLPRVPGVENDEDDEDKWEEEIMDAVFVLSEMLKLGAYLDFSDEMGRKGIVKLVREMLAHPILPEVLVSPCLDLLQKASQDDAEFIATTLEVIQTISQAAPPGPSAEISNEGLQAMFMRLVVCNGLLERVQWPRSELDTLRQIQDLIVKPALKVPVPQVCETALTCLGLLALESESLARKAVVLCIEGMKNPMHSNEMLRIVLDLAMVHQSVFDLTFRRPVPERPDAPWIESPLIVAVILEQLDSQDEKTQTTAVLGACKMLLMRMIDSADLLEALTLLFFAPDTTSNVTLRQCLSTFFQAYCYSSPTNQAKFAEVILPAFTKLCIIYEGLREEEDGEPDMILPERILGVLLEYADPTHVVGEQHTDQVRVDPHIKLALDMLEKVAVIIEDRDDSENPLCCVAPICQTLSQIQLPPDLEQPRIQTLLSTVADILTNHTPDDKTIFKHLSSFETRVRKVSARKRIAGDEQDREGDSESDHAATVVPAPARKQNARAETKRKMVARSETEAEDLKASGKKKRKSDVTASTAPEGDGQDTQLFVPIRAEEAKKSRARLRSAVDGGGSASASEATGTAGASSNPKKKQARPKKKRKSSEGARIPSSSQNSGAENVPLPVTAHKKPEMNRPKPTASGKLSAKDKRSVSGGKPKQIGEEDKKATRAPMLAASRALFKSDSEESGI